MKKKEKLMVYSLSLYVYIKKGTKTYKVGNFFEETLNIYYFLADDQIWSTHWKLKNAKNWPRPPRSKINENNECILIVEKSFHLRG